MKRIIFFAVLFCATWFAACSDDDEKLPTPVLSFASSDYTLSMTSPLTVEVRSSIAVETSTVVGFTVSGNAEEGKNYTLSATEFTIPAGGTSAQVVITPMENYEENMEIVLELKPVEGFELGTKTAKIALETGEKVICSFVSEYYVLASEAVIGVELKKMDGSVYIASEDVHLSFTVAGKSTAKLGKHFEIEGGVTEFVIPKGKMNTTVKVKFLEQEVGKDEIVLDIKNAGTRFMMGNYDEAMIKVYGPTTVGKLFGKWTFDHTNSFEDLKSEYEGMIDASNFTNMPVNNKKTDEFEFVAGENNMLKVRLEGDMKNYFRDCEIVYLRDTTMRTGMSEYTTYSLMEMSNANANFSATVVNERKTEVAFRVMEDGKTLEVTLYDYEPKEFFQEIYDYFWTENMMWDAKIQYYFTKVEE
ncbi:MAG: hypothetical protein K2O69_03965 [Odoribacter sp.]|nr:hypothetical protein [Odoribacter sp.]